MRTPTPIRLFAIATLSASTLLYAQTRPSSPPETTSLAATAPTTEAPAVPLTPAQSPPQRASVSYADGQITVSASNSSLNQILRDISRQTGIKITGGVADERVFGNYGPASPNEILATLLDGTGSNMILTQSADNKPSELILTPRMGGPTPPNPNANAAGFNDASDEDEQPLPRRWQRQNLPPREAQSTPAPANPTPQPVPPPPADNNGNNTGANPAPNGSNQQQSPNGTRTPQQIFEELQRMRQQQQQQQQQQPGPQ